MPKLVVFILLLPSTAFSLAAPLWSMGAGVESRIDRDVNPDHTDLEMLGQLFASVQWEDWGALIEGGQESQDTNSGGFSISTSTRTLSGWGRYHFLRQRAARPFLGLGLGAHFDEVQTTYGTSQVDHSGERMFTGIGAGMNRTFWEHLLLEGEVRGVFVEERQDPLFSGLVRVGMRF